VLSDWLFDYLTVIHLSVGEQWRLKFGE